MEIGAVAKCTNICGGIAAQKGANNVPEDSRLARCNHLSPQRSASVEMLHDTEKANLPQTLERTRAAIGVFADLEGVLRSIRKGMAPTSEKVRVEEMMRLNRQTLEALERKLAIVERELSTRI